MNDRYPIAELAMARLEAKLAENGSKPSDVASSGLRSLIHTYEKALRGELADKFYLASLDPGQGKSLGLSLFLNVWAEHGYNPDEGALIGVSRFSEIKTLVSQSGLKATEYGVLTSNEELNALGLPKERHESARVLFTTQQMIIRRCAGQRFADATAFHYRGKPRKLRIWDETLTPAEPFTVGRDNLGSLLAPLRLERNDYATAVEDLMHRLFTARDSDKVFVPIELADIPTRLDWTGDAPTDEQRDLVEKLRRVAGRETLVVSDGRLGNTLVGVERSLPSDFAPVVVLDASGRVRPTYSVWSRWRGDLERLPPAVSDYSNLNIHVWPQASGRRKLRDRESRTAIVTALAEAINREPESGWLVVHYKDATDLPPELLARVAGDPSRIRFLPWGNHHGTNEFRDIPNVALVGQFTYRRSGYVSVAFAAGLPESHANEIGSDFKDGEWAHHTLQAALRGSARKVINGKASRMDLFMVLTPSPTRVERLKRIFPGAVVSDWEPFPKGLTGQAKALADYLSDQFTRGVRKVRKKVAREEVGIRHSSNLRGNVLDQPAFIRFMEQWGIRSEGQHFVLSDDRFG